MWELTSAAFWIIMAVPIVNVTRRFRPPALYWVGFVGAMLLLSGPLAVFHSVWLEAARKLAYSALGETYTYDWDILYEWRKDLLSLFLFAGIGIAVDRWTVPSAAPTALPPPFRLEVRDGARVRWFAPGEIERVEAAGNYVELHTAAGPVLHRATLSGVEAELSAHGFVRVHRSRLVRRDAVTGVRTTQAGDFEASLASGAVVSGSRRFRSVLE